MKLANPNQSQEFDRVTQDRNGTDLYGYRHVDGQEEIVHIPSGESNMQYHQPEMVLNPEGCSHIFGVVDIRKREIECRGCHLMTSFHPAVNYREEAGKSYIVMNYKEYELLQ